jgi:hypothetical protein
MAKDMRELKLPNGLSPAKIKQLAETIDRALNENAEENGASTGFVLMVFPFEGADSGGFVNYISNTNQRDVVALMRDQLRSMTPPHDRAH